MNDNKPTTAPITLSDLAKLARIDEDTLLRRLAGILQKRSEEENVPPPEGRT